MPSDVYLLWAAGLGITLVVMGLIWLLSDRSLKKARAEFQQRHQELQARFERGRQEREGVIAQAAERAERGLALQQEAVDLARQMVRQQEGMLALLQRLADQKGEIR